MIASPNRASTRATSLAGSRSPSPTSGGDRYIASPPRRRTASSNETRVRSDGF